MSAKKWPPPGFPIVLGDHALTREWQIHLPEKFARRIEEGDLVLWRPGLTVWLAAWGNTHGESQSARLAHIKETASRDRTAERERVTPDGLTRFDYRLRDQNDDGPVESLNGFVIGDDGEVNVAVYFDDVADEPTAYLLVDSIRSRRPA
jgi:hypothetical protein